MTTRLWPDCSKGAAQAAIRRHLTTSTEKTPDYPETVNLPFNYSSIRADFQFSASTKDATSAAGFWILIQGNTVILEEVPQGLRLPQGPRPPWLPTETQPLRIGTWQEVPLYAVPVSGSLQPGPPFVAEPFNASRERMDIQTLTLAGLAKQILHWEQQSCFCSRCGAETSPLADSWGKRCTGCGAEHFPHIHPCAIVLVKRGTELLLTRKKEWNPGRYSLVAGFLDFGESLEECAIREVREETGIEIRNIRYVGSQNWPFPAQLMAGFVADYDSGDIQVDHHELEDARWFPVDELPDLPARRSIARWIIDNFK